MYQSEFTRQARDTARLADYSAAAGAAWAQCRELVQTLWSIRDAPDFALALGPCAGLVRDLPALLVQSKDGSRVDAVLQLAVARARLKPVLTQVEVLGWLARDHPDALVTLLRVVSTDAASGRVPQWAPIGMRRARRQSVCDLGMFRPRRRGRPGLP